MTVNKTQLFRLAVPARIVNISQDVSVNEGGNVYLFCLAVGRPEPTVTWKENKCKTPVPVYCRSTQSSCLLSQLPVPFPVSVSCPLSAVVVYTNLSLFPVPCFCPLPFPCFCPCFLSWSPTLCPSPFKCPMSTVSCLCHLPLLPFPSHPSCGC